MQLSEVGTAYLSILPKVDRGAASEAAGEVKQTMGRAGDEAGKTSGQGFGSWFQSAAGVFVGNVATRLVDAGANAVKQLFQAPTTATPSTSS